MKEPQVKVGILTDNEIRFFLNTNYVADGKTVNGKQSVSLKKGSIYWNGNLYQELVFIPLIERNASFELFNVSIGISYHWERKENQRFLGTLKLIVEHEKITAVNILPVEYYLISVISSEMSANSSLEFLKAHAVISRSWLLAQVKKKNQLEKVDAKYSSSMHTDDELIRWYDREDHLNFDVCADDHCQRYQGITRASNEVVVKAVEATRGQLLYSGDNICDARFSKCCGGVTEEFNYCWEDSHYPYLSKIRDDKKSGPIPDLRNETEVRKWIKESPESYCNTQDKKILSQILNNYDQETSNFYRWKVSYNQKELSRLIYKRSGIDYGEILDLIPVERGVSGRLSKLKIVGTKRTLTIGKELEIRRTLSESHLYSSAFVIDKTVDSNGIPETFVLTGAGWGHGVGLCQIGAAVMGEKGFTYDAILLHYYTGGTIKKMY